jgi:hypothetical protein
MADTLLKSQQAISSLPPQGYMINGKIVPSVASNNLTVALKTLAGNDPSPADPVVVRIADTVRKITAALSFTVNAGTNWLKLGDSYLATKEVDLFVYLYYTSGTLYITASRIAHANTGSDFYLVDRSRETSQLNSTAPGSADATELIGRFAATMSAGAGYTWTVPTFTSANLIQRPIRESRILTYTSAATTAAGSLSDTSYTTAVYKIIGQMIHVNIQFLFDQDSSTSEFIYHTIPFYSVYICNNAARLYPGTGVTQGCTAEASGASVYLRRSDGVFILNCNGNDMRLWVSYPIV